MSDKDLQVGKINFNNFKPNLYLDTILKVDKSQLYIDKKVFQLADKMKQDMIQLKQDYKNNNFDIEFLEGAICNSLVMLDWMAELWNVNLDEYSSAIDLD